jgi:hypothetical protein
MFLTKAWTKALNCIWRLKPVHRRQSTTVYIKKFFMFQNQTINRENLIKLLIEYSGKSENRDWKVEDFTFLTYHIRR